MPPFSLPALCAVKAIRAQDFPSIPQTEQGEIKHAPKIFKETCKINWNQPAESVRNFVRGLSPYPAAWTVLHGKTFKIFTLQHLTLNIENSSSPGTVKTDDKDYLYVKTLDGWVAVEELQPEGKRRMKIQEFFRGNKIVVS